MRPLSPRWKEQFREKYEIAPGGCWLWTGSLSNDGYSFFQGRSGHRLAYETHRAEIPEGLVIDHLCRVRRCVNPEHLEPVSHQENVARGLVGAGCHRGNSWSKADRHGMAKLSSREAAEIRDLARHRVYPQSQIARLYNVTQATVCYINRGKIWRDAGHEGGI